MLRWTKVTVFDDQHDKLRNAIAHQKPISIKLNRNHGGENTLLLTRSQIATIERSKLIEKRKVIYLFYFILFYFILFYFILFYFILFYFILFYFILFLFTVSVRKIYSRKAFIITRFFINAHVMRYPT